MRISRRRGGPLVDIDALTLTASGPIMILRGRAGMTDLRAELDRQRIEFPASDELPPRLRDRAGRRVRSGGDARAYSELIKEHLDEATGGRSYAEITAELSGSDKKDEKLVALRQTAFMGESLRSGPLGAYQASNIIGLVVGLGALFTGVGAALRALARGGRSTRRV